MQLPGDAPRFLIPQMRQASRKVAQTLGCLVQFRRAFLNAFLQFGASVPKLFFGLLSFRDVRAGRMEKDDAALVVANRVQGEIHDALGAIRPMVEKLFAVRRALRGLRSRGTDFALRILIKAPPAALPERAAHDFLCAVAAGIQAETVGVNDRPVE